MMRTMPIIFILCACGPSSEGRYDYSPPPSCTDIANKVHQNCVSQSDQPCDGSVYAAAYEGCLTELAAGRSPCVPDWQGKATSRCVPLAPEPEVTKSTQPATPEDGS